MDGWAVGRFGPGPDVITLTSLTYVRTLEPTVALGNDFIIFAQPGCCNVLYVAWGMFVM